MHYVLQDGVFNPSEFEQLVSALTRFNLPFSLHKVIPFIGELYPEPVLNTESVICFGSYSMRHYAKKHNWTPGVFDLEDQTFDIQLKHWGNLMLNADSVIVPFKDATITESAFIRPVDDSKHFSGQLITGDEFTTWQSNVNKLNLESGYSLTSDTLIQVSIPKTIYAEYRFWIIDRQIVTYSMYKRGDRVIYSPNVDNHVIKFAESVVRHGDITCSMRTSAWQPHKAYVLDVCETPNGMKVVEINTMNSAGFYAGNVASIIDALERMEK